MKTTTIALPPVLVVTLAALALGTTLVVLTSPPAGATPPVATSVYLPPGVSVDRPRGLTTAQQFNDDMALQQVALDVASYCQTMTGSVPVTADLIEYLETTHDHVWDGTSGVWKYKMVVEDGIVIQVCYLEKTIYVQNDGESEPAVVSFEETMIL